MSSASYVKRKQTNFVSMRQRALVFIPLSTSRIDAARCCSWLVAFYMDTHGNRQTAIWPSIHPTWFYIRILLWTQYTYLGIHNMDVWVSVSDRYTLNIKKNKRRPHTTTTTTSTIYYTVWLFFVVTPRLAHTGCRLNMKMKTLHLTYRTHLSGRNKWSTLSARWYIIVHMLESMCL